MLGFSKQWLSQILTRDGKQLKALSDMGFTGSQIEVQASRENVSGASLVKTISLDDLALLILFGAINGKKEAIAIQLALTKMSINDFFRDAFEKTALTIEEKRALFYKDYAKTIDWFSEDRKDLEVIKEQELFLSGNW